MSYEINTVDSSYQTASARSAARVAVAQIKIGLASQAWAITHGADGRLVCHQVPITTVAETARQLAAARRAAFSA